ncbi:hypothetical protein [Candidatus Arthromitus sp. SFB-rat-Yit]|uniref:hypothetical protein n=1 Tax=Candidatus Arthromitus sp. SFB-rat-Yit TaxID=1041504 RepID=UPI000227A4E6|nr:hypothetical protein [Candidatus Arthromitus sp. SFB-rat-Yit]BAK80977.1 hypothetical protein RATSFB_0415 [Candidatus Arthromitus sp. SFB-rat-Yit]
MTTLYEHNILGSKISMISTTFNIPFLFGEGTICLYEQGVTFSDENGDEKYIIGLDELVIFYETFVNIRNLKYIPNVKIFTSGVSFKFKNLNKRLRYVKGSYYGKMVINIDKIGKIELLDNQSFKYRKFYNIVNDLKNGISPLNNLEKQKETFLSKLFKYKLF